MPRDEATVRSALDLEAARIVVSFGTSDAALCRQALERWAGEDADRMAAAGRVLNAWSATAPKRSTTLRSFAVTALLGAALAAGAVIWDMRPELFSDHHAARHPILGLELRDGVIADLDAGSMIDIDEADGAFVVDLIEGAVHLSVNSETVTSPVIVRADEVEAEVTGTQFAVTLADGSVSVAVSEGQVRVSPGDAPDVDHTRPSGPSMLVDAGTVWRGTQAGGQISTLPVDAVASWRSNWLVVENRPLRELADVFGRRFTGTIIFADGALADQRVSGSYRLDDPMAGLAAAVAGQNAQVTMISPWVAIVRPK
ncbi:MAG: FecR domain-containing protein [Pseudomonadota bacterium]